MLPRKLLLFYFSSSLPSNRYNLPFFIIKRFVRPTFFGPQLGHINKCLITNTTSFDSPVTIVKSAIENSSQIVNPERPDLARVLSKTKEENHEAILVVNEKTHDVTYAVFTSHKQFKDIETKTQYKTYYMAPLRNDGKVKNQFLTFPKTMTKEKEEKTLVCFSSHATIDSLSYENATCLTASIARQNNFLAHGLSFNSWEHSYFSFLDFNPPRKSTYPILKNHIFSHKPGKLLLEKSSLYYDMLTTNTQTDFFLFLERENERLFNRNVKKIIHPKFNSLSTNREPETDTISTISTTSPTKKSYSLLSPPPYHNEYDTHKDAFKKKDSYTENKERALVLYNSPEKIIVPKSLPNIPNPKDNNNLSSITNPNNQVNNQVVNNQGIIEERKENSLAIIVYQPSPFNKFF